MKTELFISWRYLSTKRKEKFISLISVISILGVAIGVAALIVVIGVMSGFDKDLREKIVGNYSHLTVAGFEGIAQEEVPELTAKIKENSHVIGASPHVQGQMLIKTDERYFAVSVRGIDPATERQVTKLDTYMLYGSVDGLDDNSVIIGKELALYFGLNTNSEITVYSPKAEKYTLKVGGIFQSGMYDYDMNLVFATIPLAQKILGIENNISAISVKLDNLFLADEVKEELGRALGYNYGVRTWKDINSNFFAALELEKLVMFIILTLIVLVASFNIISMLVVMVVEKTKDIGILKALGMSGGGIKGIFTLLGFLIGGTGTALGLSGGFGLCALLKKYQFINLPQDIYYIDHLPVSIQMWPDIAVIVGAAMVITLISTIYPAHKAGALRPAEALRYE